MRCARPCIPAAAMCCIAASLALAQAPAKNERLEAVGDRLLDEAERQHMVNRRMDASIEGLDALIRDLVSNDLLAQGRGPRMQRFVKVLAVLNTRHVPNAERYLQAARKRLEALRPSLTAADGEIKTILRMLDDLLKRAERSGTEDDLLTQLRLIIRKEENLHAQTREWGKLLYTSPEKAETGREELRTRQRQIAASVRQFEGNLNDAAKSDADLIRKDLLTKAAKAMKEEKIDRTLDRAAGDIDGKKPIPAVRKQADALEALRRLEEMLQEDSPLSKLEELRDSYQELSEILARQEELRETTEQVPEKQFAEKAKPLQLEQQDIRKDLGQTTEEMPEAAVPQVRQPLQQAAQHMDGAVKDMQRSQQTPAVEDQKKAEESIKKAMKQLEGQIAEAEQELADQQEAAELAEALQEALEQTQSLVQRQVQLGELTQQARAMQLAQVAQPQEALSQEAGELADEAPQEAGKPLEEASGEMHEAAQALEQGQRTEAGQHQQRAIQALQQAARAIRQLARRPTPPNPFARTDRPRERGSRDFGKQKAGRGRGPRDKKLWDHLNPREREAVRQAFARDLPLEYRELLEDYYEALSK